MLVIQLQPARSPSLVMAEVVATLRQLADDVSVTDGYDTVAYVSIALRTDRAAETWSKIRQQLQKDASLADAAIVVCQGDHGWDDYLLLHHFDRSQPADELAD